MEYVVFENLVLWASSTGATAWSRSIDAGARNGAMFEVTLRSVSKSLHCEAPDFERVLALLDRAQPVFVGEQVGLEARG